MSVYLSVFLSVSIYFYQSLSFYQSLCLSIRVHTFISVSMSFYQCLRLSVSLHIFLSVSMSFYQSLCISISVHVFLSVSMCLHDLCLSFFITARPCRSSNDVSELRARSTARQVDIPPCKYPLTHTLSCLPVRVSLTPNLPVYCD